MNAPDEQPLYRAAMRPFAVSGLRYEAVHMIVAVLAAAGLAAANYLVAVKFNLFDTHPLAPIVSMAVMVGVGFFAVYWEMSFFPRSVVVFPDRVHFKMLVSSRDVATKNITAVTVLTEAEAKRTYFDFRCANLSPGITGMVRLDHAPGRAWVFAPEDPEEFAGAAQKALDRAAGAAASGAGP